MTCNMQMMRTSPSTMVKEWTSVFPDFTTVTGSCLFIKKLIAVSLSAVTYIRGIFPEKAYGDRHLCGIKLKLLTEDCGIEAVNKFIELVRSCYEAVEKKYLHQLSIGICLDPENNEEVIESYSLDFRYRDDEFSIDNHMGTIRKLTGDDPTVEGTLQVLKSILDISDLLDPLPQKAYLTMKLLYNDEITPTDYEPPGFQPCENEKFSFPPDSLKLEIGKVFTEVHGYKMYLKTILHKDSLGQMLKMKADKVVSRSEQEETNARIQAIEDFNPAAQDQLVSNTNTNGIIEDTFQDAGDEVEEVAAEDGIECICDCKQDKGTDVLECSFCGKKQHSVCYGILKSDEIRSDFYCIYCISATPQENSLQDSIYSLKENEQRELGAFRRALVLIRTLKVLTPFQLEKILECAKQLARDSIERLDLEGFIKKSGNKYIVNQKNITNIGYPQYFPRSMGKENVADPQNEKVSKQIKNSEERGGFFQRKLSSRNNELPLPKDQIDRAIDNKQMKTYEKRGGVFQRKSSSKNNELPFLTDQMDYAIDKKQIKTCEERGGVFQRKSSSTNDELPFLKDQMDYAIDKKVQKLSLGSTEKQRGRSSKRRSLKEMTENDCTSQELFQPQPSKKRTLNSRKSINITH